MNFIISIILGLCGIIPAFLIKKITKKTFTKNIAILLMIPISLISTFLLFMLAYAMGIEIANFSFITLFITCYFTYVILLQG